MRRLRHRTRASATWSALLVVGIAGAWALSTVAFSNGLQSAGASVRGPVPMMAPTRASCGGAGGPAVRALYVVGNRQRDRFTELLPQFRRLVADIDGAVAAAGRRTGGERHVRFIQDAACQPVVDHVVLPQEDMASVDRITAVLREQGYDRRDRQYLYWYDTPGCEPARAPRQDDSPGPDNAHNRGPGYAAVGAGCWTWQASARALLGALGAVQNSAPHATDDGRCWDGSTDLMCIDVSAVPGYVNPQCTSRADAVIDCNADDYFNSHPPAGSYLDTHWNVARSAFLTP